jgi:hypothetical protein
MPVTGLPAAGCRNDPVATLAPRLQSRTANERRHRSLFPVSDAAPVPAALIRRVAVAVDELALAI